MEAARLRAATLEEVAESVAFALRYDGRKRVHHADEMMALITAERLVRHLLESGFVLMKRPENLMPTTQGHMQTDRGPAQAVPSAKQP